MPTRDKLGEGRSAVTLAMQGVREAIDRWQTAPDAEKGAKALNVLSHVGSLSGMKVADFTDEKTVKQIKADYASINN